MTMKKIAGMYTAAFSGLNRASWLLSVVMLVNRMGTMVLPFMTLYLTQVHHYSIAKASFVIAIFGAGAICGGFLGGKLTDKLGFYYVQISALLGGGIMFIILGRLENYTLICFTTFFLSVINESFRPANAAAITHYSKPENRTRSFSLNRLSINLGWAVGGMLGGIVAAANYHLLFWIDGLTNICAALLLWFLLAPSKNAATATATPTKQSGNTKSAYRDRQYIVFIVLTTMFGYSFFQIFSTLPVYYKEKLHLSEYYIGLIMAINGLLVALFEMVIVHKLEGRGKLLSYISAGTAMVGFSFIMFNIFPGAEILAMASIIIITIGEILAMPFMNTYWTKRSTDINRGQYAGLFTMSWATAQVLGPATGGQIANYFGYTVLWWFIGSVLFISAAGYYMLNKKAMQRAHVIEQQSLDRV